MPQQAAKPWGPKLNGAITLGLIFAGGALGTAARFAIGAAIPMDGWPWATFLANISGTAALALLVQVLAAFGPDTGWRRRTRLGLGTGLLGGYTTYSTFALETVALSQGFDVWLGFAYCVASLLAGLAIALFVFYLTDRFLRVRAPE